MKYVLQVIPLFLIYCDSLKARKYYIPPGHNTPTVITTIFINHNISPEKKAHQTSEQAFSRHVNMHVKTGT